jgi:hypothetical protein
MTENRAGKGGVLSLPEYILSALLYSLYIIIKGTSGNSYKTVKKYDILTL